MFAIDRAPEVVAELVAAGYRGVKEPFDAFWGMRYATVLDPDGNGVDLPATPPATCGTRTPGGSPSGAFRRS